MPPVVQNTRGIHEIGKDRVCKNQLSGRTDVPLHTYIHTEKFPTVVTKLRLATLAPIIISTKYLYALNAKLQSAAVCKRGPQTLYMRSTCTKRYDSTNNFSWILTPLYSIDILTLELVQIIISPIFFLSGSSIVTVIRWP